MLASLPSHLLIIGATLACAFAMNTTSAQNMIHSEATAAKFDKGIGVVNTARNWNTVLKLHELALALEEM